MAYSCQQQEQGGRRRQRWRNNYNNNNNVSSSRKLLSSNNNIIIIQIIMMISFLTSTTTTNAFMIHPITTTTTTTASIIKMKTFSSSIFNNNNPKRKRISTTRLLLTMPLLSTLGHNNNANNSNNNDNSDNIGSNLIFDVRCGSTVDLSRMDVTGSDYSNDYPMDDVIKCSKHGSIDRATGQILQKAHVILSMGPNPESVQSSQSSSSSPWEQGQNNNDNDAPSVPALADNEYAVKRGTQYDKTRMYVVEFERSKEYEGGFVLRTLNPGVYDRSSFNTEHLADVIVSSGPNGDWKPESSASKKNNDFYGGSGGDPNSGKGESRGQVSFSGGTLGPPGGIGKQEGYIYGPTEASPPKVVQQSSSPSCPSPCICCCCC